MSEHTICHSSGLVDESLDYLLTSLRINESYLGQAPVWLREMARPLQCPQPKIDRLLDQIKEGAASKIVDATDTDFSEKDENPEYFIGREDAYLQKTAAPKLPRQLAVLGIVPRRRKLVFRGWSNHGRVLDLNIYWNRQDRRNDSEQSVSFIEETTEFFFDWQMRFGWSVKGIEFLTSVRKINLVFSGRQSLLPSERWHEIVLNEDPEAGAMRLVAT